MLKGCYVKGLARMEGFNWPMLGGFIDYWEEDEEAEQPARDDEDDDEEDE